MHFLRRRPKVLVPDTHDLWGEISLLGPGSVLVAISFPRYTRLTIEAARAAHEAGATVISLTDSTLSPLAPYSNHVLPACYRIDSLVESYVAALSVLNAVVTGIAFTDGSQAFDGLKRLESLWKDKGVYYEAENRTRPSWIKYEKK